MHPRKLLYQGYIQNRWYSLSFHGWFEVLHVHGIVRVLRPGRHGVPHTKYLSPSRSLENNQCSSESDEIRCEEFCCTRRPLDLGSMFFRHAQIQHEGVSEYYIVNSNLIAFYRLRRPSVMSRSCPFHVPHGPFHGPQAIMAL